MDNNESESDFDFQYDDGQPVSVNAQPDGNPDNDSNNDSSSNNSSEKSDSSHNKEKDKESSKENNSPNSQDHQKWPTLNVDDYDSEDAQQGHQVYVNKEDDSFHLQNSENLSNQNNNSRA